MRVWPYLLSRVLLPALRNAGHQAPLPASAEAHHSTMPADCPPLPAGKSTYPLDVTSWVHTTAPQVFRAAAEAVAGNAQSAAPLGVPTLMAILEPYACFRGHPSPPSDSLPLGVDEKDLRDALAAQWEHGVPWNNGCEDDRPVERSSETVLLADLGAALTSAEVDAARAEGAAAAADAGGSEADGLVSRMALEALGLLVDGLAGQNVSTASERSHRYPSCEVGLCPR